MNLKVRETIKQFGMLTPGEAVIAAVSGGADSVALLDLLCALLDLRLHVRACHLNHCLRGEESDRDEQLVRTMCAQYGIPLDVRRVEVRKAAAARKQSIELAAREERYAFFEELAALHHAKVATAHTLSDTAETVLFNMARGSGLEGLCGIPTVRGQIIRPLMTCTRQDVERYCARHDLYFVMDSTNKLDDYARNFIRHNLVPQMVEINGGALRSIGRMTALLRRDAEYLSSQAEAAAARCGADNGFLVDALRAEHPAIRSRVLMLLLEGAKVERTSERLARLDQMLFDPRMHTVSVGGGCYALVRAGVLQVQWLEQAPRQTLRLEKRMRPVRRELQTVKLDKNSLDGREVLVDGGKTIRFLLVKCEDYEFFKKNLHMDLKNAVDYDKIIGDILLRSRTPGDRLCQVGRNGGKPLKKLFSELRLANRDQLCVLADEQGVFFAEGAGVDRRAAPSTQTRRVLILTMMEEMHE